LVMRKGTVVFPWFIVILFVRGCPCPRDLRTVHRGGRRISYVVAEAGAEAGFLCNVYIFLRDEGQ